MPFLLNRQTVLQSCIVTCNICAVIVTCAAAGDKTKCNHLACIVCRVVVLAMVVSLAGVLMTAQPSFIFGGEGLDKRGLALGISQVGELYNPRLLTQCLKAKLVHTLCLS